MNAHLLLKRIPIFTTLGSCLFKSILLNIEISSFLYIELKQFLSKYIHENLNKLVNDEITVEVLNKRKIELLEENIRGNDIDFYLISSILNINFVLLNENNVAVKYLDKMNLLETILYFGVDNDNTHIELLTQYKILEKIPKLKEKALWLLKILISLKESNKKLNIKNY